MEDFRNLILKAEQVPSHDVEGLRSALSALKPHIGIMTQDERARVDEQVLRLRTKMTSLVHYHSDILLSDES